MVMPAKMKATEASLMLAELLPPARPMGSAIRKKGAVRPKAMRGEEDGVADGAEVAALAVEERSGLAKRARRASFSERVRQPVDSMRSRLAWAVVRQFSALKASRAMVWMPDWRKPPRTT